MAAAVANRVDVAVIGAGIVGLATARELARRRPDLRVAVLEKEQSIALHQTGRNSNVIHSGIYYKPESLKAQLCAKGAEMLYRFCDEHKVPYKRCGKLIVAVKTKELPSLEALLERGRKNGVKGLEIVSSERIKEIEPHCKGLGALYSPNTGIVDYAQVSQALADDLVRRGGQLICNFAATKFDTITEDNSHRTIIQAADGQTISANNVVACAGLFSDRIAQAAGGSKHPPIVAFRGEYTMLKPEYSHLVRGLIYPVNNPAVPFLGVHFTKRMDGGVDLGPNAVLAFAREGYRYSDINLKDLWGFLSYRGTQKLIRKHWWFGIEEYYRSLVPSAQLHALQQWIPEIQQQHLVPRKPGVRAIAVGSDGELLEDFIFDQPKPNFLNVRNAPSPAATSALAIADVVVDRLQKDFLVRK